MKGRIIVEDPLFLKQIYIMAKVYTKLLMSIFSDKLMSGVTISLGNFGEQNKAKIIKIYAFGNTYLLSRNFVSLYFRFIK